MITVTSTAQTRIQTLIEQEGEHLHLRMYVEGGGCSGFQYGFTLDEVVNEDDFEIPAGNFKLLIDSLSMQYLNGTTLDFKESITGSNFIIKNPNATASCGCGSSFSAG